MIDSNGWGWGLGCGMAHCQPDSTLDTIDIPDVSHKWRFEMQFGTMHNGNYYAFDYTMPYGITSSVTLENDPNNFREVNYTFAPREGDSVVYVAPNVGRAPLPPIKLDAPYHMKGYLIPSPVLNDTLYYNFDVYGGHQGQYWWNAVDYHVSPMALIEADRMEFYDPDTRWGLSPIFSTSNFPVQFKVGYGAPYWVGRTGNLSTAIRISGMDGVGLFRGPTWFWGYTEDVPMPYKLFHGDTLISSYDVIYLPWPGYFFYTNVTPSQYVLEIFFNQYKIADEWGLATTRLEFDLSRQDPDPPSVTQMFVLSNGFQTDELFIGEINEVIFKAVDISGIDSVKVYFKSFSGLEWVEAPASRNGNQFKAGIPTNLNDRYSSMRLRITDSLGNVQDHRVEPAFLFNRVVPATPSLTHPVDGETEVPNNLTLRWNRSVGANSYHLQLSDDSNFTHIVVDDSDLTTTSLRVGPLGKLTTYYWKVGASNIIGSCAFSESRRFTTADATVTIDIQKGWNLVSVPLNLMNSLKRIVCPNAISDAFLYNGYTYVQEESLRTGIGYWLEFQENDALDFTGYSIFSDTINLLQDWNLIGSVSTPILVNSIISDPPGMSMSSFFSYQGSYTIVDTIKSGKGYWVKANQTGKLILASNPLAAKLAKNAIKIIATSEMPPPPPEPVKELKIAIPYKFALRANYPNPFNPITTFQFSLAVGSFVTLKVYNVLGQELATVLNRGEYPEGEYEVEFVASNLSSGVYYYRLVAEDTETGHVQFTNVQKMLLLK